MVRRHTASALAAVLTAAALVVAVPSGPASAGPASAAGAVATADENFSVNIAGDHGAATYTPENATLGFSQSNQVTQQMLTVSVASRSDPSDSLTFEFQSRENSNEYLQVGYYGDAQTRAFADPGRPGISVSSLGFCNDQSGNFEVRDIRRADNGISITAAWITFHRYCDGQEPVFGEIRFGYPADATELTPSTVRWPQDINLQGTTYPGFRSYDVPVRVRSTSATPADVTGISVVGPHAGDFVVRNNDCDGTLTATGCEVTVGFVPGAAGPRHARLKVATTQGDRYVSLDGAGEPGESSWVIDVTHEDGVRDDEHLDMPYAPALGSPYRIQSQGFQPDGIFWNLDLNVPYGQTFTEGQYRYNPDRTGLGISIARGNAGCEIKEAMVDIDAIDFSGPDKVMSLLDMTLDIRCGGSVADTITGRVTFHARDDVTAPAAPATTTATRTGDDVSLSWDVPNDQDLAGVLVRRYNGDTAPGATDAGEVVHLGTDGSATFPAPESGPVAVSLWSYDTSGNVSEPRTVIVPEQQR